MTKFTGIYNFVKRKRYKKFDTLLKPKDSMIPLLPKMKAKQENITIRDRL
jgi:hypothetical protein